MGGIQAKPFYLNGQQISSFVWIRCQLWDIQYIFVIECVKSNNSLVLTFNNWARCQLLVESCESGNHMRCFSPTLAPSIFLAGKTPTMTPAPCPADFHILLLNWVRWTFKSLMVEQMFVEQIFVPVPMGLNWVGNPNLGDRGVGNKGERTQSDGRDQGCTPRPAPAPGKIAAPNHSSIKKLLPLCAGLRK